MQIPDIPKIEKIKNVEKYGKENFTNRKLKKHGRNSSKDFEKDFIFLIQYVINES